MPRGRADATIALRTRVLRLVPLIASLAILLPLAWLWQDSRVPAAYSGMEMGYADLGGSTADAAGHVDHAGHTGGTDPPVTRSVSDLVADPARTADVRVELVARQQRIRIGDRELDGFTLNGATPGPEIRAVQGQLVEVRLRNASVTIATFAGWETIITLAGGIIVVETVFAWPGLGLTIVQALERQDVVLLQATVFTVAAMAVVINILVDILHKILDPRVELN